MAIESEDNHQNEEPVEATLDEEFEEQEDSESQQDSGEIKKRRRTKGNRPFPANALKDAIGVAQIIREFNGGNPWHPDEVAKALEMSSKGNNFYYLTASSRDYGFTEGYSKSEKISLASTGQSIAFARSEEEERNGYNQGFFNIPLFKKVYDYYIGGLLPEIKYLKNTLVTEFDLSEDFHDDFYQVYQANLKFISEFGEDSLNDVREETESSTRNDSSNVSNIVAHNYFPEDSKASDDAVILGEPEERTTLVAFVALPFSERTGEYQSGFFREALAQLIAPAAIKAGFKAETARKTGSDVIQRTIISDLSKADLMIVDLTEHNPNVLFELGWRMALEKPVALIRAAGTRPIFDVDNMLRVYDYNPRLWKSTLEKDIPALVEHIKATWDNKDSDKSYAKILSEK